MNNKNYKCGFYTISPLHIGTGEEIEPSSYIIKNGRLYCFDFTRLMLLLNDTERKELRNKINNSGANALLSVRKYLSAIFDYEKHKEVVLYEYNLKHNNVINYYNERFNDKNSQNVINNLAISSVYRDNYYNAIIPGSSIKGMIRNAFEYNNMLYKGNLKVQEDPFKYIKISDGNIDKRAKVDIAFVHEFLKDGLQFGNGVYSLIEYVDAKQYFTVEINIDLSNSDKMEITHSDEKIAKENIAKYSKYIQCMEEDLLKHKTLIDMLNKYYQPKFEKLYNIIKKDAGENHPFIKNVKKVKDNIKDKPLAFIQLGKYGGQEMYNNEEKKEELKCRRYLSYNEIKTDRDVRYENIMPIGWVAVM